MALIIFTRKILAVKLSMCLITETPPRLYVYIDDIVEGVVRALDHPPKATESPGT